MAEEKPEEENEPEEKKSKTPDEMSAAASTFIRFLNDQGFTPDEGICVLALASSLAQIEMTMQLILKNATVMSIPIPQPTFKKPSDN